MKKLLLSVMAVLTSALLLTSCKKDSVEPAIEAVPLKGQITKYKIVSFNSREFPLVAGTRDQIIKFEVSDVDNLPNDKSKTSYSVRINTGCGIIRANMVRTSNFLIDMTEFKDITTINPTSSNELECKVHSELLALLPIINDVTVQPSGYMEMFSNRDLVMNLIRE